MHGTIRRLAISVACLVILAFPGPVAADGASNCVSGLNYHQWRGVTYTNSSFQIHGVSGKILRYNLIRCSPPVGIETDGTFVFSNIVPAGGGANDIIQVGVGDCRAPVQCSGGMRYYSGVGLTNTTPGCAGWQNRLPALIEHSGYTYLDHVLKVYHHSNQWEFVSDSTVLRTFADASKAKRLLNWTGRVSFADGLRRTVDWFKAHPPNA